MSTPSISRDELLRRSKEVREEIEFLGQKLAFAKGRLAVLDALLGERVDKAPESQS